MRFQKEVYEKYLSCLAKGKHVAARISHYDRYQCPAELTAMLRASKLTNTEELGVLEIPVSKIVGIASICGKESYAGDFLPIVSPKNSFVDAWCSIYSKYINNENIAPIICYEYLGKFYVVDGKKRVSVMKCNGSHLISANVTRIHPVDKESPEVVRYYEFLKSYKTTGLYQIDLCSKFSFEELQNAIGCDVDYQWNEFDRAFMLATLETVDTALKASVSEYLPINAIDAFMVLVKDHSYQVATQMSVLEMAKYFKKNKKVLIDLYCPEQYDFKQTA